MRSIDLVAAEARNNKTVIIDAFEKDGSRESREIEPYSLRPGKAGDRLMFWCLKRDAMRSVLVHNIVEAAATGRTFVPRYPIEF
jgi:predicted DNA-binding transcriptional regulator YafY